MTSIKPEVFISFMTFHKVNFDPIMSLKEDCETPVSTIAIAKAIALIRIDSKNELFYQLCLQCAHHFPESHFFGAIQRPGGREVYVIDPGNQQNKYCDD